MKSLKTATVFALSALLVACGGGGGGGADPNSRGDASAGSSTLVASTIKGIDGPDANYVSTISTVALAKDVPTFSNIKSLSNFTMEVGGPTSKYDVNFTGVSAGMDGFYDMRDTASILFTLGGTSWSYSRFGLSSFTLFKPDPLAYRRLTPFFIANVFSPATLADATYANGRVVGILASVGGYTTISCTASAAYTHTSQKLELTLSACSKPSGTIYPVQVPVTGTIVLSASSSGVSSPEFSIDNAQFLFGVGEGQFKFGGPTGEELVGAVTVVGSNKSLITFAFGAKK
jgi:hypothetical protein